MRTAFTKIQFVIVSFVWSLLSYLNVLFHFFRTKSHNGKGNHFLVNSSSVMTLSLRLCVILWCRLALIVRTVVMLNFKNNLQHQISKRKNLKHDVCQVLASTTSRYYPILEAPGAIQGMGRDCPGKRGRPWVSFLTNDWWSTCCPNLWRVVSLIWFVIPKLLKHFNPKFKSVHILKKNIYIHILIHIWCF